MDFIKLSTTRTLTTNNVSINGDTLTLEIVDATVNDLIGTTNATGTFSLSELISTYSQDHGCIALFPKAMHIGEMQDFMPMETTQLSLNERAGGDPGSIQQKTTVTPAAAGKEYPGSPWSVINSRYASYSYLYILTPYAGCSVDEITIVYRDSAPVVTKDSQEVTPAQSILSMKVFLNSWLPITVAGPDTITLGQTATYTVTAPANTTVYVSSDIGIVNRARVAPGKTFILNTDGLEVGETVTIKAGYKFWAGVTKKTITVS